MCSHIARDFNCCFTCLLVGQQLYFMITTEAWSFSLKLSNLHKMHISVKNPHRYSTDDLTVGRSCPISVCNLLDVRYKFL